MNPAAVEETPGRPQEQRYSSPTASPSAQQRHPEDAGRAEKSSAEPGYRLEKGKQAKLNPHVKEYGTRSDPLSGQEVNSSGPWRRSTKSLVIPIRGIRSGVQSDGRHVIASANAMCPSKPSDVAMSRYRSAKSR